MTKIKTSVTLSDNERKAINFILEILNENHSDLEKELVKKIDTSQVVGIGIQMFLAEQIIEKDLPDEEYIKYRNCITNEYVNKKLMEYEYSRLLNLPKWKNCEPHGHFNDMYKLMTYHLMKGVKGKNYSKNFRISSEGSSINTILKRYFPEKNQYSYEISAYPSVCREWVKQGIKDPSGEAKITLREEGIKFFEMYYRAIELWYEREFLNTYDKSN